MLQGLGERRVPTQVIHENSLRETFCCLTMIWIGQKILHKVFFLTHDPILQPWKSKNACVLRADQNRAYWQCVIQMKGGEVVCRNVQSIHQGTCKSSQNSNIWNVQDGEGYKSPDDEDRTEDVILEGEQSQTHVGEDEVLSQEVKHLKELRGKKITSSWIRLRNVRIHSRNASKSQHEGLFEMFSFSEGGSGKVSHAEKKKKLLSLRLWALLLIYSLWLQKSFGSRLLSSLSGLRDDYRDVCVHVAGSRT